MLILTYWMSIFPLDRVNHPLYNWALANIDSGGTVSPVPFLSKTLETCRMYCISYPVHFSVFQHKRFYLLFVGLDTVILHENIHDEERIVFRLVTSVRQRKNSESFEEPNLRPSDSALRCSMSNRYSDVSRSWQDEKYLFLFIFRAQNLTSLLFLSTNITLSTLLILAVWRTLVKWTS